MTGHDYGPYGCEWCGLPSVDGGLHRACQAERDQEHAERMAGQARDDALAEEVYRELVEGRERNPEPGCPW